MHYIDDIVLAKQNKQVPSTLEALGRQRCSRRWEIKPTKIQRPVTPVVLGSLVVKGLLGYALQSKKDKFPDLASATVKKEAKHLAGFLRITVHT